MKHSDICSLILDESGNLIYLSELDTYELIYANKAILRQINCPEGDQSYIGKKCYKVLQGLDQPCEFCTNSKLSHDEYYCWENYNELFDEYFSLKDKLIMIDGRPVRLEIAVNMTKTEKEKNSLKSKLTVEETLISCIHTLSEQDNIQAAIESLLHILSDYYQGERGYIFEFVPEKDILNNTYEWCREGIISQRDNLQDIPMDAIERWMEQFKKSGEFFITSLGKTVDKNTIEYEILLAQGIDSLVAAPLLQGGEITGFIGVDNPRANVDNLSLLTSVTCFIMEDLEKRRLLESLKKMSFMDMLTRVKNRNCYLKTVADLEADIPDSLGVVYMDMDGLKVINDTYGHNYGDVLIREMAHLMEHVFSEQVYRIGGDEFVAVVRDIDGAEFDKKVAELRSLIERDGRIHASIGSSYGCGRLRISEQINYADNLMYAEKQSHYRHLQGVQHGQNSQNARELIHSIEEGDFVVYLQPKFDLHSGKMVGAEALVRKHNEEGGLILPGNFIPLYEAEGIIRHVDLFVLEIVCDTLAGWRKAGVSLPKISVNFSRITLMEYEFVKIIVSICGKYGIEPEYIGLEVTESVSRIKPEFLQNLMKEISGAGFTLSLDDFGSQYSNLAVLTNLGFDELKLDRSLIGYLGDNERSRIVVEHTIEMCRDLHVKISVAEGIETEEQAEILRQTNCDWGQGYYFAKPMPIHIFYEKYLQNPSSDV